MSGGFFRSTSIVGAFTLLSRVTGLLRDMVYSRMFGAGVLMDAFLVAFKIPNFMRRLFAEGGGGVVGRKRKSRRRAGSSGTGQGDGLSPRPAPSPWRSARACGARPCCDG